MGFTMRGVGATSTSFEGLNGMGNASVPLATVAPLPSGSAPLGVSFSSLAIPPSLARHTSFGAASGRLPLAPSIAGEDPQIEVFGSLGAVPSGSRQPSL